MKRQWSTNLSFILAAAGSAIGIGNIWKFPKAAYEGGGGAYLLVYVLIAFIMGTAILIAEFALGRGMGRTMIGAFLGQWKWVGYLGVFTAFLVLCYYYQAGGWILRYFVGYIADGARMLNEPQRVYFELMGSGGFPLLGGLIYPAAYIFLNVAVVKKGLIQGAERLSRIAMPLLFALLIALLIRALTMEGACAGVDFLMKIDFSRLGFSGLLNALGQAFFSLSIGMSVMVTYGAFLNKSEPLIKNAAWVCALDTGSALIAAFIVIPAVFASGNLPSGGGSFAFVEIAEVFNAMRFGSLFGLMFYALLFLAAFVSSVSILEGILCCLEERWKVKRGLAGLIVSLAALAIGVFYTADYDSGGMGAKLEVVTDRYLMPAVTFLTCAYLVFVYRMKRLSAELNCNRGFFAVWRFTITVIAPIVILLILVCSFVF
ncbi:MAG: sodium-dependent transporter [Clostridia bacterium]|nr:sodium-dependent transporter [Clostridia bacterium]